MACEAFAIQLVDPARRTLIAVNRLPRGVIYNQPLHARLSRFILLHFTLCTLGYRCIECYAVCVQHYTVGAFPHSTNKNTTIILYNRGDFFRDTDTHVFYRRLSNLQNVNGGEHQMIEKYSRILLKALLP